MKKIKNYIYNIISQHKAGKPLGITSICSANFFVIKSAILNAKKFKQKLLIESTSNQVDQFGGYTGITPIQFRNFIHKISTDLEFPFEDITLGGDHLGPNRWQSELSANAMKKAKDLVSSYIQAGYTKIHLDTTIKCADDGDKLIPLSTDIIAERSAQLCKVAEETFRNTPNKKELPVYVIGSDVPLPGGAKFGHNNLRITLASDVEETINLTKKAFYKYNLQDAWHRVVAIVVQPGVEFGDNSVIDYDRSKAIDLINLIEQKNNLVYEAHSTDYQKKDSLKKMVGDHFVILKVGPWLTFAFREAIFALSFIENELFKNRKSITQSNLIDVVENSMKNNPTYWANYYGSNENDNQIKRKYSYSDRIRYYWSQNKVNQAINILLKNLSEIRIPDTLISQFLPDEYFAIREGTISAMPEDLIHHKISKVIDFYNYATHTYGGVQ